MRHYHLRNLKGSVVAIRLRPDEPIPPDTAWSRCNLPFRYGTRGTRIRAGPGGVHPHAAVGYMQRSVGNPYNHDGGGISGAHLESYLPWWTRPWWVLKRICLVRFGVWTTTR